jgi:ABC-type transport system involved in cytochrome bd biosynthesis fused ATPase/permease subunit
MPLAAGYRIADPSFFRDGSGKYLLCLPGRSSIGGSSTLARKIGDGEWLESLPQGLDTQVGERGGRLSMGQRQLISLMRVLVQQPAIFILDEATASIDPFTEWQIQQALKLILQNTTSILIAHRLSTVKAADRIIVLEYGQIVEEGNHNSLLTQNGALPGFTHLLPPPVVDYKPPGRAAGCEPGW